MSTLAMHLVQVQEDLQKELTLEDDEQLEELLTLTQEAIHQERRSIECAQRLEEAHEWILTLESADDTPDPRTLAMARLWASEIDRQYGDPDAQRDLSLESDDMTLEGVVASVRKGLRNIARGGRDAVTSVNEFMSKLSGNKRRLRKNIEKMAESVSDADIPRGREFKVGGYAVRLHVEDRVDPSTIVDAAKDASRFVNDFYDGHLKALADFHDRSIKDWVDDISSRRLDRLKERSDKDDEGAEAKKVNETVKELTETHDMELPGGYRASYEKSTNEDDEVLNIHRLSLKREKGPGSYTSGQEVPVATRPQLLDILKAASETLVDRADQQKLIDNLMNDSLGKIEDNDLERLAEDAKKDGVKMKMTPKRMATIIRLVNNYMIAVMTDMTDYSWRFSRSALKYCNASYKASKPSKDDD